MSDPTNPQEPQEAAQAAPGTAIATQADKEIAADVGGVGELPADARTRIAVAKSMFREKLLLAQEERNFMAAATKITWARELTPEALKNLAGWAKEPLRDLDLLTEFNVLGGTSGYVNAKWYMRQLGYLVAEGLVDYAYYDTITRDDRFAAVAKASDDEAAALETKLVVETDLPAAERDRLAGELAEAHDRAYAARREIQRRADLRMKFDLPESAKSAIVWHVKLHNMGQEVVAAQAVGGYRGKSKSGTNKDADPIGEDFPRETCITRGCRKVMLSLAHVAPKLKEKIEAAERVAEEAAQRLPELQAEGRTALRRTTTPLRQITDADYAGSSGSRTRQENE